MRKIKVVLFVFVSTIALVSCQKTKLPADLLDDNAGVEKLTEYIYSHYPNLKEEGIEVMEFNCHASIHPERVDELSSNLSLTIVKGDDKERVVEYSLNNEGRLMNNLVDITVGDMMNEKLSNTYDTYKPYLFSDKEINLDMLRKIKTQAVEDFKKETNVEAAYCSNINISKKPSKQPTIGVTISQRKFASPIRRHYNYTLDGKKI